MQAINDMASLVSTSEISPAIFMIGSFALASRTLAYVHRNRVNEQ